MNVSYHLMNVSYHLKIFLKKENTGMYRWIILNGLKVE